MQYVPRASSDSQIAIISRARKLVLVTNDADFADPELYPKGAAFSVVLLKIRQDSAGALLSSFGRLLREMPLQADFEGKSITLTERGFEIA